MKIRLRQGNPDRGNQSSKGKKIVFYLEKSEKISSVNSDIFLKPVQRQRLLMFF